MLQGLVREQSVAIQSLRDRVGVLEGRERRRRSRASRSTSSGISIVRGSAFQGSGTREFPIVEREVEIHYLEPEVSEGEEVVPVENEVPVPVPGPSEPRRSLADRIGGWLREETRSDEEEERGEDVEREIQPVVDDAPGSPDISPPPYEENYEGPAGM